MTLTTRIICNWLAAIGLALGLACSAYAQDDLNLHGVVSDAMTSSKLGDVEVTVKKDGATFDSYTTRANGKYEFYLDCGSRYELVFEREGYVDRSLVIDSKGIPEEVIGAGIIMPTDMSMYEITEAMEGADLSVFDKPIGKAAYDPAQADLVWDFGYTNQVKGEIFKFIRDIEKKQKELEKEATAEEKAAQELEEKFNEFVQKGDDAMGKDDYEDAVINYQAALELKPGDGQVQAKLGDAQTKWNNLKAEQQLEADYSAALDAGDGFMRTEEFDKAIEKYQEALELKPGETYPEDQIAEAERIIEERKAEMAKQEEFNAIMAEADGLVDEKKYAEAIPKYEEALTVIPGNSEAERKLENARSTLAELKAAEEKKEQYDALIAAADSKFQEKAFQEALTNYEEAASLMPDEEYPQTRIEACEAKIAELEAAAEKQAEFDELIAEGDEAMTASDYEEALAKFKEALEVIPGEKNAEAKRDEAQALLDEKLAEEQKQENYDALISEADDAFDGSEYETAKSKYQEAKELIPEETYPTEKISEIDRILAELAEEQEAQKTYESAMAAGRKAMEGTSFAAAVGHFEEALAVFPEDKDATSALEEAREALQAAEALAAKKENYDKVLGEADDLFASSEWEGAIAKYEEASSILPEESYPGEQIEQARINIENEKAQAEQEKLQAQFDQLVQAGDAALTEYNFDTAISKYEEALDLMDSEEVETKIADAEAAKEAYLAEKDLQEQYDAAVASADALYEEKDWDKAILAYQEASGIKPEEAYPKDQIALIEETIAAEEAEQQAALQAEFDALVAEGDKLVEGQNFDSGIAQYEAALEVMESPEVETKIEDAKAAKEAYLAEKSLDEQYDSAIATADALYEEKDWDKAILAYQEASGIKPEEAYPNDQIALIEETIAAEEAEQQAALQAEFDALVAEGDKLVEDQNFDSGIAQYEAALEVMGSPEVETKIEDAKAAKEAYLAEKSLDEQYDSAIASADALYEEKSWDKAILAYQEASGIKPEEAYPNDQIALIEETIAAEEAEQQAALQAEFDALVASGDKKIEDKDFSGAITDYEAALEVMDSAEVEEKIQAAQDARAEFENEQQKRQRYDEAITEADILYGEEDWEGAQISYSEALSIYPDEEYPQDQLDLIAEKIAEAEEAAAAAALAEKNAQVDALVGEGDEFMKTEEFDSAIGKYEEALGILPEREEVSEKLAAAESALLAKQESEALEAAYLEAIEKGDKAFDKQNWQEAIDHYTEALTAKPNEAYPQERIDEATLKLEALAEAERLEREAELKKDFDKLIASGDKQFGRTNFEKALEDYSEALALLPENQLAKDKVAAAEEALGELKAEKELLENYQETIDEADQLFKDESYEMAKLKYADAAELMPSEKYPKEKITEIDLILEKQRLAELAQEKEALERAYREAIDEGDAAFASSEYEKAKSAYEEALELKEEENYPLGQLEKIEMKIKEEERAEKERERLAALEEERRKAKEERLANMNRVNTDSEDQAEDFMREAREAEEKERHERIKKIKAMQAENLENYEENAEALRNANYQAFESFRKKFAEQANEPAQLQKEKVGNSIKYKEALLANDLKRQEMDEVRNNDQYAEILALEKDIRRWKQEMQTARAELIRQQRSEKEEQLAQIEEWNKMSYNEKIVEGEKMRKEAAERQTFIQEKSDQRIQNAREIQRKNEERSEFLADLNEKDIVAARETKRDIDQRYAQGFDRNQSGSKTSINNSDAGKSGDFYRSELAENYPQGVTEESSTLGNKVIIRRIVVQGGKGDEYKKVVDKAGEYFFKNGQSISENTWNRETIEAFNKSKD